VNAQRHYSSQSHQDNAARWERRHERERNEAADHAARFLEARSEQLPLQDDER
jgi:hypothetical protein